VYIGIFTKNARIVISHQKELVDIIVGVSQKKIIIDNELLHL
jgi:hypothetical protein